MTWILLFAAAIVTSVLWCSVAEAVERFRFIATEDIMTWLLTIGLFVAGVVLGAVAMFAWIYFELSNWKM